jgi:hypothetical protein
LGAPGNIEVCLWATMSDEDYYATILPVKGQGQQLDVPCDHDLFVRRGRVFLLDQDDLADSFSTMHHTYTYKLLNISSMEGAEFLLGIKVRTFSMNKPPIHVSDVEEGLCTGLVEVGFDDPFENYTPLPHGSLGAAIVRNVLHAAPERRLQRLLAAEARRYVGPTARFLAVERERFEAALRGGAAAGGG